MWGAENTYVHYICQNDRTVTVTNVTNSTGAVINSTATINNNWTTSIGNMVNESIQYLFFAELTSYYAMSNSQFNDTWLRGVN